MTKEELAEALKALDSDPEDKHFEADRLLLAFINDARVTAAFKGIRKWYA